MLQRSSDTLRREKSPDVSLQREGERDFDQPRRVDVNDKRALRGGSESHLQNTRRLIREDREHDSVGSVGIGDLVDNV